MGGIRYLRIPVKTRLIKVGDRLMELLKEYAAPRLAPGDLLFVSEKIAGTPQFRGLGHETAPAMQLLIEEAGYPRVLFAAAV